MHLTLNIIRCQFISRIAEGWGKNRQKDKQDLGHQIPGSQTGELEILGRTSVDVRDPWQKEEGRLKNLWEKQNN